MHELNHELSRLHGGEHIHAHGLLLHGVHECLGHLIVHVGLGQCSADIFERLRYVDFSNFPFTFQYLKRALKSVT